VQAIIEFGKKFNRIQPCEETNYLNILCYLINSACLQQLFFILILFLYLILLLKNVEQFSELFKEHLIYKC